MPASPLAQPSARYVRPLRPPTGTPPCWGRSARWPDVPGLPSMNQPLGDTPDLARHPRLPVAEEVDDPVAEFNYCLRTHTA